MEIRISKSARQCQGCQTAFVHEQKITSVMRRGPEGWLREDYCPDCFTDEYGEGSLCVWSAQFEDPQVLEQQPAEVLSPLRQAFYEAAERSDRASVALAYLAGQLLRRQKAFRFIKQAIDPETEAAVMLFLDRICNKMIEVHDPNLTTAELERGRVALLHRLAELEGTLDEPETPPATNVLDSAESVAPATGESDSSEVECETDEFEEDEFDDDDEYDDEIDGDEVIDDEEETAGDGEAKSEYAQA